MKLGKFSVVACLLVAGTFGGGCSRHKQEAVILANEGDNALKLDADAAIGKYEQATKLDPQSHQIFFKLGNAYRKREEWEKAAGAFGSAAKLMPAFANYWFQRGYALEMNARKKGGAWAEAKEPYEKCVAADPNYADCLEQLGEVHLHLDDERKALEYYTKAIEQDPAQVRFYSTLGDLYIRLGFSKEASQVLKEAKAVAKPGDRDLYGVHVLLAQLATDSGASAEAVKELEAAKVVANPEGPESVQVLFSLGSAYAKLEPPKQSEATTMLKGFHARACKGAKAQQYKAECDTAQTLIAGMGGTVQ